MVPIRFYALFRLWILLWYFYCIIYVFSSFKAIVSATILCLSSSKDLQTPRCLASSSPGEPLTRLIQDTICISLITKGSLPPGNSCVFCRVGTPPTPLFCLHILDSPLACHRPSPILLLICSPSFLGKVWQLWSSFLSPYGLLFCLYTAVTSCPAPFSHLSIFLTSTCTHRYSIYPSLSFSLAVPHLELDVDTQPVEALSSKWALLFTCSGSPLLVWPAYHLAHHGDRGWAAIQSTPKSIYFYYSQSLHCRVLFLKKHHLIQGHSQPLLLPHFLVGLQRHELTASNFYRGPMNSSVKYTEVHLWEWMYLIKCSNVPLGSQRTMQGFGKGG